MNVTQFIKDRLKERSTRIALAALATSAGWLVTPEQIEVIAPVIVLVLSGVESLIKDNT